MPKWTIRMCVLTGLAGMGLGPEAAFGDNDPFLPTSQARSVSVHAAGGECGGKSWQSSYVESADGFDPFDATVQLDYWTFASQQSSISGTVMSAIGDTRAEAEVNFPSHLSTNSRSPFRVTFTVERPVIVTIDAEVHVCVDCATAEVRLTGTPFSLFVECGCETESETAKFLLDPGVYSLIADAHARASDGCGGEGGLSYASYTVELTVEDPPCPVDLDGSGSVDFGDILAVLAAWGNAGGPEDLDGSLTVDFGDILVVLGAWGPCE